MDFFEDSGGTLHPISDIERVYREDQGLDRAYWAELRNGNTHRLAPGEFENLRHSSAPFTSAAADHYALSVDFERDANDPVVRTPVIGWLISPEFGPMPVTLDGLNDGLAETPAVLFPNGQVHDTHLGIFDSVELFTKKMREEN
jgi:hypothetical protein